MRPTGIEYPVGSGTYVNIDAGTSDYRTIFLAESDYRVTATTDVESRRDATGLLRSISVDGRSIPMMVNLNPAGSTTVAQFNNNVKRWFDPGKGRTGTRYLRIEGDDGTTVLRLPVHVVSLAPRPNSINIYDVVLQAVTPYFEAMTEDSEAITTSGTATNAGNARAQATLEFTGGTSLGGKRFTVTDNSGHGLTNYPVVINYAATSTQSQAFVLVNGASVPFREGSTSAYYWVFVNVPAGGSVTIDIIINTGITNPLSGVLNIGPLDPANTSNANHTWNTWSVKAAPVRTAMWRPADPRINWTDIGVEKYEIDSDSSSATVLRLTAVSSTILRNDASAVLVATGLSGQASSTLTGFSRVMATNSTSAHRAYVYYRTRDSEYWELAWSVTASATVTTSLDLPNAVEIIAGLEYVTASSSINSTLTLSWNTSGVFTLLAGQPPTVSAATATTWRLLDGTVTNTDSGQVITFDQHIRRDGTLTIAASSDYTQRAVQNSVAGPILGDVQFSDTVDLFSLEPGANDIEETVDGGVTVKFRDTYL